MPFNATKQSGITRTDILIGVILIAGLTVGVVAIFRIDTTGRRGSGLSEEFTYDLSEQRSIDPNLILYKETFKFSPGLTEARSIFVDNSDNIHVAGDKSILVFAQDGRRLSQVALTDSPRTLAVNGDGVSYVAMTDHVMVYDKQGKLKSRWENLPTDAFITSIAVWQNNVFVADAGNRLVLRYNTDGKLLNQIGKKDREKNIEGFVIRSPYFDLAVASDGLLRVANPGRLRIEAFTFEGDLEFFWGKPAITVEGFCGCCNPINFALLSDDGFVTCEKGLTRVKIYDAKGIFVGVVAGPEQFIEHDRIINEKLSPRKVSGLDVAVNSHGQIVVLDPCTDEIRVFAESMSK